MDKFENRKPYEKPVLRKVRLEVKTSVLATCNTSVTMTPNSGVSLPCTVTVCQTTN